MLRASVAAEKEGIPAVSIIATPFLSFARALAKSMGVPDSAIAEYPGLPMNDSYEQLREKVINHVVPKIIEGWSRRGKAAAPIAQAKEPAPRDIIYRNTLSLVQEFFHQNLWSDGLPIIPPTLPLIDEFLRFTDRAPDEVIGICPPECREATVWNVAVNGVMAGCRPEYMPILIAVVEAITDPVFNLEDGGATPGWEPLIVLNGPLIKELDFNYGGGVMRVGRQANTSIGRFLRLYIRNIAGQRIPPGATDKATTGLTFNVVLAEDEDAASHAGWQPFSVDRGFASGENVVTVLSVVTISQPTFSAGKDALNHVQIISEVIGQTFAYWSYTGIRHSRWYPLIVVSPSVAKTLSDGGWSKDAVRKYLFDNVKTKASLVEKYARNSSSPYYSLKDFVQRGKISSHYYESDDPDRMVRVFVKPEWIGIVVAGDPGRNQSRGYVQSHRQGVPVSKSIKLPQNWWQLLQHQKKPKLLFTA